MALFENLENISASLLSFLLLFIAFWFFTGFPPMFGWKGVSSFLADLEEKPLISWNCNYCGKAYRTKSEYIEHEKNCSKRKEG